MLKILKHEIPILKGKQDGFIRKGYYGGHTDYYESYLSNGYYYDINSLYPYAMLKPMPHKRIKHYKNMSNINLNDFFGYIKCEIETPNNILKPLLPYKDPNTDKTIYPIGKWTAIYFSEELKAVSKYGYKIKLLEGYEFSKIDLFSDYVYHFYEIKKQNKRKKKQNKEKNKRKSGILRKNDPERFIAKFNLKTLYGLAGKKTLLKP